MAFSVLARAAIRRSIFVASRLWEALAEREAVLVDLKARLERAEREALTGGQQAQLREQQLRDALDAKKRESDQAMRTMVEKLTALDQANARQAVTVAELAAERLRNAQAVKQQSDTILTEQVRRAEQRAEQARAAMEQSKGQEGPDPELARRAGVAQEKVAALQYQLKGN